MLVQDLGLYAEATGLSLDPFGGEAWSGAATYETAHPIVSKGSAGLDSDVSIRAPAWGRQGETR